MVNDPVIMNYHDKVIPDQRLLGTVSILYCGQEIIELILPNQAFW